MAATSLLNTKFEELCRLCGSKADSLAIHIFEDEGTFSELGKKIFGCLQIQIDQQDELPKLLCDNCLVKLEMFWDFKYRSLKTEQLLLELCKQLKNTGTDQQCLVQIDDNGIILEVPNQQLLPHDLHSDINISELDRRHHLGPPEYSVVLSHDNLEGLQLGDHSLTGQDVSNQSLHNVQANPENEETTFTADSLDLMQHQLVSDEQNIHMSIVTNVMYPGAEEQLHSLESSSNSLGAEVDSHLKQIISEQEGAESAKEDYSLILHGDGKHQNGSDDLSSLASTFFDKSLNKLSGYREGGGGSTGGYFKYVGDKLIYSQPLVEPVKTEKGDLIINYKDDLSLDSIDGLKNEDSSSGNLQLISDSTQIEPEQTDVSNESGIFITQVANEQPVVLEHAKPKLVKVGPKVCSVCGKSYKSNYKLTEHMTKHTGERPYKCKSCDKGFRSKVGLAQHEAKHTGQYELRCSTCGKGFQCKSYLMVHQRVHSDLKPYHCAMCGINFKTKQSLLDHTNRHLGVKPFTCTICSRGFITKSLCMAHEKTHSGVDNRKYSCQICQKRFVSKSYLQTHSRIHTGEKTFICEVCGKGFLASVDLKIHLTVHTGEKSFVCEMCGKAFARRDALKCHRRMHTGERPYSCDICGRTFTQFTPMANHKKNHTGEKPFTCETCGRQFVSRSSMVSHQKKGHKSDKSNISHNLKQLESISVKKEVKNSDL